MNVIKDYKYSLGKNIQKIREELGLSRSKFAKLLDYSPNSSPKIGSYERGHLCCPLHVVIKIMEVAEIPMEDLYDILFDENYKLPKRYKPYANGTDDYERFLTDRRIPKRA